MPASTLLADIPSGGLLWEVCLQAVDGHQALVFLFADVALSQQAIGVVAEVEFINAGHSSLQMDIDQWLFSSFHGFVIPMGGGGIVLLDLRRNPVQQVLDLLSFTLGVERIHGLQRLHDPLTLFSQLHHLLKDGGRDEFPARFGGVGFLGSFIVGFSAAELWAFAFYEFHNNILVLHVFLPMRILSKERLFSMHRQTICWEDKHQG